LRPFARSLRPLLATGVIGALIAVTALASAATAAPIGAYTTRGAWSFVSAPNLHPPKLHADRTGGGRLAPGYFMLANFPNLTLTQPTTGKPQRLNGQSGPLMLDSHLQPVWFDPLPTNVVAGNLRAQTYNGKPVLSWWQGVVSNVGTTVSGEDVVVGQNYKTVATLTGKDGWVLSEHEMVISGHNAWVTAYKNVPMDLTPYRGVANGVILDSAVQEYDLTTGDLLYTWDALSHIPPSQSYAPPAPALVSGSAVPWDAYHVNSIQLTGNGTFLVSMRNTWGAYLVDRTTANIDWALGGKPFAGVPTFSFGRGASFQWQHDVELHARNVVSVFDDACCLFSGGKFQNPSGPSRALMLTIDTTKHTASLAREYHHSPNLNAAFLGNTEQLGNGGVVVGWGSQPFFSEFSKSGKLLLDATWPGPDQSYRAYVQSWVGKPFFAPSGAVRRSATSNTVYASWDGATQLAAWRVLAGNSASHLGVVVRRTAKTGFETAIKVTGSFKVFRVQALDGRGRVIGSSGPFPKPKSNTPSPGFY
jgi:Arylsulfotransferase (ASST)